MTTGSNVADSGGRIDAGRHLWRFVGYYGAGEVAQRVTRLATTVLLARLLSPMDLGIAATAITCFELIRSVANSGVGQAVVRTPDSELAVTCGIAHRLTWILCLALALLQAIVGAALAHVSSHPELGGMIALLAVVYLMMPPALIQTYLLQRASRHGTIAAVATLQAVIDNILTLAFALAGWGAWAIVLPKLITTPIWMLGMRRAQHWRRDPSLPRAPATEILRYSIPVMGAELLMAARLQLDKAIVGAFLGVEALGIYYFVFNAGLGLSLSLTGALSNSLYPYFAAVAATPRLLRERFDLSLVRTVLPISLVVLAQALLAPLYVPLVFGAKWTPVTWLVAVLCLSAMTKLLSDAGAQALRAAGATAFEFRGALGIAVVSLVGLAVGLIYGLATGVTTFAIVSAIAQLVFAWFARAKLASARGGEREAAGVAA